MLQTVTESQPGEKTYAAPTFLNQPAPPLPSTTPHFTLQMQMIPEAEVERLLVDLLAGQEVRLTRIVDLHPTGHLPHDELDVLVVDRHALVAVHPLDLFHEVLLGLPDTLDLEKFLGIPGALDNGVTGPHLGTVGDLETSQALDQMNVLGAVIGDHGDLTTTTLVLVEFSMANFVLPFSPQIRPIQRDK